MNYATSTRTRASVTSRARRDLRFG